TTIRPTKARAWASRITTSGWARRLSDPPRKSPVPHEMLESRARNAPRSAAQDASGLGGETGSVEAEVRQDGVGLGLGDEPDGHAESPHHRGAASGFDG